MKVDLDLREKDPWQPSGGYESDGEIWSGVDGPHSGSRGGLMEPT